MNYQCTVLAEYCWNWQKDTVLQKNNYTTRILFFPKCFKQHQSHVILAATSYPFLTIFKWKWFPIPNHLICKKYYVYWSDKYEAGLKSSQALKKETTATSQRAWGWFNTASQQSMVFFSHCGTHYSQMVPN